MSDDEKFDAIVIGAGTAGCACAYTLAKAGKAVLLVERGVTAGSKNVTGGRLYTYALEMIEPGLYKHAPLQRKIVREQVMMLGPNSATTIDYSDYDYGDEVPQSYSVLRAPFDEWFAEEAEAQGAMVACGILVDELIERDGKIVGIKAGEDEMYADVVIAADGVNSLIAQKAGLRSDITAGAVGVGVKEVIELPEKVIQERFNLKDDEGVARVALGCTEGISGGAFFYTNKDSISMGIIFNPEQVSKQKTKVHEMMQEFKMHPAIHALIAGGETTEYGAHLVPELGLDGVPENLYRDGLVVIGDAAGLCISAGVILRGMDLAILSGLAAANAVINASVTAQVGPLYKQELDRLIMPTMKAYSGFHHVMGLPRLFTTYPELANDQLKNLFTVDGNIPEKMGKTALKTLRQHVTFGQLIADGWKGVRSI